MGKKIQMLEDIDIMYNTDQEGEELNKSHSEYTRWLSIQNAMYRQKS